MPGSLVESLLLYIQRVGIVLLVLLECKLVGELVNVNGGKSRSEPGSFVQVYPLAAHVSVLLHHVSPQIKLVSEDNKLLVQTRLNVAYKVLFEEVLRQSIIILEVLRVGDIDLVTHVTSLVSFS